jgi:hypothetical protein
VNSSASVPRSTMPVSDRPTSMRIGRARMVNESPSTETSPAMT